MPLCAWAQTEGASPQGDEARATLLPVPSHLSGPALIAANVDLAWDYTNGGGIDRALTVLRGWEQEFPQVPEYPFTRGAILYQEARHAEALAALSRALDLGAKGDTALWARLYAADILLIENVTPRAEQLLSEVRMQGSPTALKFAANIRQRIRIREELSEVNEIGGVTFYLPDYLIPARERAAYYDGVEAQWQEAREFLGLAPLTPEPTIYLYPSARLYDKYIAPNANLAEQSYSHQEIHVIYTPDGDVLADLAPYALYQLQQQIRRGGQGFAGVNNGLDEAIRNATEEGVPLGSFLNSARSAGKLPLVESVVDPRNTARIPPEIAEPMMGMLLRMLHDRFPQGDFHMALTQPAFLGALARPVSSYQLDFESYLNQQSDLLVDPVALDTAVEAIPPYAPLPVIEISLKSDLVEATQLIESGDRDEGLVKLRNLLGREPRYGEARYLLAKDYYDHHKLREAEEHFGRVLEDTAPGTAAFSFAHFYLGRITKLRKDYPTALLHYQTALHYGLPALRKDEARWYAGAIGLFLDLEPLEGNDPGPHPGNFFYALDQSLNGTAAIATWFPVSPTADVARMEQLASWYEDPERLAVGVAWGHRVLRYSQIRAGLTAVEVEVWRLDAEGETILGWKPEIRRFLLINTPSGAQIVNYADELDIFRPAGQLVGPRA